MCTGNHIRWINWYLIDSKQFWIVVYIENVNNVYSHVPVFPICFNVTVLYFVDGDTDGTHKGKRYMYTPSDLGKFFKLIDLTSVLDPKVSKFCEQTIYQLNLKVCFDDSLFFNSF